MVKHVGGILCFLTTRDVAAEHSVSPLCQSTRTYPIAGPSYALHAYRVAELDLAIVLLESFIFPLADCEADAEVRVHAGQRRARSPSCTQMSTLAHSSALLPRTHRRERMSRRAGLRGPVEDSS